MFLIQCLSNLYYYDRYAIKYRCDALVYAYRYVSVGVGLVGDLRFHSGRISRPLCTGSTTRLIANATVLWKQEEEWIRLRRCSKEVVHPG